jgi:hypothetical protein
MSDHEGGPAGPAPFRQGGTDARAALASGTVVLTLDGALPVDFLAPGDRIVTRDGARRLAAISRLCLAHAVAIDPGVFGAARPEAPLVLGPGTLLRVGDWRATALFRQPTVNLPARRFVDGRHVRLVAGPVASFRLTFAEDQVIYAGGLEIALPALVAA